MIRQGCLLRGVFGVVQRPQHLIAVGKQLAPVWLDQLAERALITRARRFQQPGKIGPGLLTGRSRVSQAGVAASCALTSSSIHSPVICLVAALSRFQTLIVAIESTSAPNWLSS